MEHSEPAVLIRGFIGKHLVVFDDDATFTDEDHIFQMGFVNSLFAMEMVGFVEREFGITVEGDDLDIANFSSVRNILRFVEQKRTVM